MGVRIQKSENRDVAIWTALALWLAFACAVSCLRVWMLAPAVVGSLGALWVFAFRRILLPPPRERRTRVRIQELKDRDVAIWAATVLTLVFASAVLWLRVWALVPVAVGSWGALLAFVLRRATFPPEEPQTEKTRRRW
jgi:cobalamin synthase